MKISDLELTEKQITGNANGILYLASFKAGYEYVNGKRTDNSTFIKYDVVSIENDFDKITIKVPGTTPVITAEQLSQKKGNVKVKFKNLTGKFYRTSSGEYALTCKADGIEVIV